MLKGGPSGPPFLCEGSSSDRIAASLMLAVMISRDGFLGISFAELTDALMALSARGNLHLDNPVLTRSMAARLMAGLRAIETMLRRLLILMAMALTLPPADTKPRADRAETNRRHTRSAFALMPRLGGDVSRLAELQARARRADSIVRIIPILYRFRTVARLLANPKPAARRMARLIARLRRQGAVRPWCPPQPRVHRLGAELGLLASALPGLVNEALADWYDTS